MMFRACFWLMLWACFLCMIAMLAACAPVAHPVDAAPPVTTDRDIRVAQCNEHGCTESCPAPLALACQDDEGYCFTTCAWNASGYDPSFRKQLHEAAIAMNPLKSFVIVCKEAPEGAREISYVRY